MDYTKNYKRMLIVILLLLLFATQALTDIFVPGLPQMAREFGVLPAKMNMTITIYVYAQALAFLVMGILSDVFGRRKVTIISLIISIAATFAISEATNLNLIILLRFFQAFGSGAVYIISRLIIKEVYEKDEILEVTALFLLGLVLSPALAPVIGAFIEAHFGWRWCFRVIGIIIAGLFIAYCILVKESNLHTEELRNNFRLKQAANNYWSILTNGLFIRYVLVVGGTFASFYAFVSMSSYMFINEYHVPSTYYSYLFTFIAFGYLIGNKVLTYYSKQRVAPYSLVSVGIIIAIVAVIITLLCFLIKSSIVIFITMITLSGWLTRMATAFINPPIQVGVLQKFHEKSSYAVGLFSCMQYISGSIGSWFVGVIPYQPSTNILISTIVFGILTIVSFMFVKKEDL
ncbi:MAG: MFS transporter [Burkholderiales bacterium]|nr:MFS transporter [Burkholderiales bacterium]